MKSITKVLLASLIIPSALLVYNIWDWCHVGLIYEFFSTPLYAIINIFIALVFAYYYTNRKNDTRKKKEIIEGIINKISLSLENRSMYQICTKDDTNFIRITQKSIKNRIDLLKEFEVEFKYQSDIKYVVEQFGTYWDLISNHIEDLEHLKKMDKELYNCCSNIANRLEKIVVYIYKN